MRAFLGRIRPEMRLIKIKARSDQIVLTVIVAETPSEEIRGNISIAAAEIIADFPEKNMITENVLSSDDVLPKEDAIVEGWVYQRAE